MAAIDVEESISRRILIRFSKIYLSAGSSALLISVAHLHPEYRFISLFALVPFLWRVTRSSFLESAVLGIVLATSYCFATVGTALWGAPNVFLLQLLSLNVLFALYGIAVNRIKKHIGFNAILIAILWLPIEYGLRQSTHLEGFFSFPKESSTLFLRLSLLFGVLAVSFVAVLINSLILGIAEHFMRAMSSRGAFSAKANEGLNEIYLEIEPESYWHHFSCSRAPPLNILPLKAHTLDLKYH
ncbi:hypothetical protein KAR91_06045 [Candidatus Pacearchaeota archaeon]|nr:hypothetical protein [Candidatus Pacearchaeota archaeon]